VTFFVILSGAVSTKAALDREAKDVHEIRVSATDGGGRAGYTLIRVTVDDQGDHEPSFSAGDYKANVFASANIGTTVIQVFSFVHSFLVSKILVIGQANNCII